MPPKQSPFAFLTVILLFIALLALPVKAAEIPSPPEAEQAFYKAGVELEVAGQVRTTDFDTERGSAGVGLSAYFTESIGVRATTAFEDLRGSVFDNVSIHGLYRMPLNKNAIYGYAGAQRLLNDGEWALEGGVGAERRWARHFATFAEIGFHKQLTGERPITALGKVGVRIPFL